MKKLLKVYSLRGSWFDVILIETVGVGREIEVDSMVDFLVINNFKHRR